MLTCVRWHVAYPLSLRHIEEMMCRIEAFSLTTLRCTAGRLRWYQCWLPSFASANEPPVEAGVWMAAIRQTGAISLGFFVVPDTLYRAAIR